MVDEWKEGEHSGMGGEKVKKERSVRWVCVDNESGNLEIGLYSK